MKAANLSLELITHGFLGGAEPQASAEIRAPAIRGQLRWWFRTLGGFKSLSPMPLAEQEAFVFGSAAGEDGRAGKLTVRVGLPLRTKETSNADDLNATQGSELGYLLFPLRNQGGHQGKRGRFGPGTRFRLRIQWCGPDKLWFDVLALAAVLGNLGSLGFRGRRAMGALAFPDKPLMTLTEALMRLQSPQGIDIRSVGISPTAEDSTRQLARWLKSCRSHGRSQQNHREQESPFFPYAKRDHDIGYGMPGTQNLPAYRPALGLPIIQRTAQGTNRWEWDWDKSKDRSKGRFASPVLLRPHRCPDRQFHGLVIFVEAHLWPESKIVYVNGKPRSVSLDLYEAIKSDPRLHPFP